MTKLLRCIGASLLGLLACGDSQGASDSLLGSVPFTQTSDEPPTTGAGETSTSSDGATGTGSSDESGSGTGGMGTDQCGGCPFTRPNVLFVLDYSTTMNEDWNGAGSRYANVRDALIEFLTVEVDLAQRMNFALMHFGHDPEPSSPGTPIAVDSSGLIDGQKLDFPWTVGGLYVPCQNEDLAVGLTELIPPASGLFSGIGTWMKGALDFALATIQLQRAALGEQIDAAPFYRVVLITDGEWTSADGTMVLSPASDNPAITAQLLSDVNVKTYVISLGDAVGTEFANQLAATGGTGSAYDAMAPADLPVRLKTVFETIDAEPGITPESCPGG